MKRIIKVRFTSNSRETWSVKRNDRTRTTETRRNVGSTRRSDTEHSELVGSTSRRRRPTVGRPVTGRHPLRQRHPMAEGSVLHQVAADGDWLTARWWREPTYQYTVVLPRNGYVIRRRRCAVDIRKCRRIWYRNTQTTRSVGLTWAERCVPVNYLLVTGDVYIYVYL